ncbi:MAG TPA: hypothetical protein VG222_17485, partial [Vicinamibacterales bacterium]|nr:hypothetical protein [Vicinamibacterales bacterium]
VGRRVTAFTGRLHLYGAGEQRQRQEDHAERTAKLSTTDTAKRSTTEDTAKRSTTEDTEDTEGKSRTAIHLKSRRENTSIATISTMLMYSAA